MNVARHYGCSVSRCDRFLRSVSTRRSEAHEVVSHRGRARHRARVDSVLRRLRFDARALRSRTRRRRNGCDRRIGHDLRRDHYRHLDRLGRAWRRICRFRRGQCYRRSHRRSRNDRARHDRRRGSGRCHHVGRRGRPRRLVVRTRWKRRFGGNFRRWRGRRGWRRRPIRRRVGRTRRRRRSGRRRLLFAIYLQRRKPLLRDGLRTAESTLSTVSAALRDGDEVLRRQPNVPQRHVRDVERSRALKLTPSR